MKVFIINGYPGCVRAVGPYAHEMSEEEIKAAQAAQEGANK